MAEEDKNSTHEVVLLHGEKFGWVDVQNLQSFLDERCCTECWVYLTQAPVGRVQQTVEEDDRLLVRVTDKPKKTVKKFFDELQEKGTKSKMMRLEQVSDRSMNRGGC